MDDTKQSSPSLHTPEGSRAPSPASVDSSSDVPKRPSMRRQSSVARFFGLPKNSKAQLASIAVSRMKKHAKLSKNSQGIPVREGLQVLYKIRRDKFLSELLIFLLFFFVFLGIIYEAYDVHQAFEGDNAIKGILLDEEFNEDLVYKKTYMDISETADYWDWLRGPLIRGVYRTEEYNGRPLEENELGYVLNFNQVVGPVQLRQLRTSNSSCAQRRFLQFGSRFDNKDETCFKEFVLAGLFEGSSEDTTPFGPPEDPERYKWSDNNDVLWGFYGYGPSDYGPGGFVEYLPPDRDGAIQKIEQLFNDSWIDKSTRAVAVTINFYNTNARLLTSLRVMTEFFVSGSVQVSYDMYSARLVLYESKTGILRACLEAVYVILWIYHAQREVRRYLNTHPHIACLLEFRNLYELLYLTVNLGCIISWLSYTLDPLRVNFDVRVTEYHPYLHLAYSFVTTFTFAAFNCLLSCLKLFKFLSLNKRANTLWLTLQRASYDITMFFLGTLIILVGFGLAANLIFGHLLADFHNIPASLSALTRFFLGDFNYEELSIARPRLAPIFFWMYNVVVIFVVINMFIAIITSYFEEVHRDAKISDRWKEGMPDLTYDVIKRCRIFGRNHIKNRCPVCYMVCCCKWRRRQKAEKRIGLTGKEVQLEVWARENRFEKLMREASRLAKRRQRSVDLFNYFERAYKESRGRNKNLYIGVSELCLITRDLNPSNEPCTHEHCIASAVAQAYSNLKEVVLLQGRERTTGGVNYAARVQRKFLVTKINKWGRKQERIIAVDLEDAALHGFDRHMNLKRVLPLFTLMQIDKSVVDERRLHLVFAEGIATQYVLLFKSGPDRETFCSEVFKAVNASSKRKKVETAYGYADLTTAQPAVVATGGDPSLKSAKQAVAQVVKKYRRESAMLMKSPHAEPRQSSEDFSIASASLSELHKAQNDLMQEVRMLKQLLQPMYHHIEVMARKDEYIDEASDGW